MEIDAAPGTLAVIPLMAIPPAWLLGHFVAYALCLRHTRLLTNEKGIFAYHASSWSLLLATTIAGGIFLSLPGVAAAAIFSAGLHGIYSLSFLEVWSLTDGSYSLSILDELERRGGSARAAELAQLQSIGAAKSQARAGDMRRLGLVRSDDRLTLFGRTLTWFCQVIVWISNGRITN